VHRSSFERPRPRPNRSSYSPTNVSFYVLKSPQSEQLFKISRECADEKSLEEVEVRAHLVSDGPNQNANRDQDGNNAIFRDCIHNEGLAEDHYDREKEARSARYDPRHLAAAAWNVSSAQ